MAKTVTGARYSETVKFITKEIEPRIHRMIEQANKLLAKNGVKVGAEIQWFIDENQNEKDQKKNSD